MLLLLWHLCVLQLGEQLSGAGAAELGWGNTPFPDGKGMYFPPSELSGGGLGTSGSSDKTKVDTDPPVSRPLPRHLQAMLGGELPQISYLSH